MRARRGASDGNYPLFGRMMLGRYFSSSISTMGYQQKFSTDRQQAIPSLLFLAFHSVFIALQTSLNVTPYPQSE